MVKIEFKPKSHIEDEAIYWINQYCPEYLCDLNVKFDYYDFLFWFLPKTMNSISGALHLDVSFFDEPLCEGDNRIAGYTEPYKIKIDSTLFDSNNKVENRMLNWVMVHESYHGIYHRELLQTQSQQQELFSENNSERIVTLQRDLNGGSNTGSNPACVQANIFAGYFMIPRQRLRTALKELIRFDHSGLSEDEKEPWLDKISEGLTDFFDANKTPIKIAFKNYVLFKDFSSNQVLY